MTFNNSELPSDGPDAFPSLRGGALNFSLVSCGGCSGVARLNRVRLTPGDLELVPGCPWNAPVASFKIYGQPGPPTQGTSFKGNLQSLLAVVVVVAFLLTEIRRGAVSPCAFCLPSPSWPGLFRSPAGFPRSRTPSEHQPSSFNETNGLSRKVRVFC